MALRFPVLVFSFYFLGLRFRGRCRSVAFGRTMVQHKVKFFCLEDNNATVELNGRVSCQPNESYADFQGRLELAQCVEWSFDF